MAETRAGFKIMSKRPTIFDVAKAAGVSKSSVSLVLQNSPLVHHRTRERVLDAIRSTRYVYNRSAAKLRSGSGTGLVGLVINDLRNPYYTELAASIQMIFARRGYATAIGNSNEDSALQSQLIVSMMEHGVSGLVVAPAYGGSAEVFQDLRRAEIPTVFVLRSVRESAFPFYSMDFARGGYIATDHLINNGARVIAFVGGVESRKITVERKSGYTKRMSEEGLVTHSFHGAANRAFGYETAISIAKNHDQIDAIVTFNDLVALGMLAGFAEVGVRVGTDIGLVGFDDIEEASQCFPKLSSVRCDVGKLGRRTAEDLLNWIGGKGIPSNPVRYPVELIVRASSQ